jgi:glutathione S-transferase
MDVVHRLDTASGAPPGTRAPRTEIWTLADRKLGGREWCLGRSSIADIHLYRLYWRRVNAPHPYPRGLRGDSLYQHMTGRAAVQRTIEVESRIGYELPA